MTETGCWPLGEGAPRATDPAYVGPVWVPAMIRPARRSDVRLIVVHVNEGGEYEGEAIAVARETQRQSGAYHEVNDDHVVCKTANDDEAPEGAGGVNQIGWHICIGGDAEQTPAQWADTFSAPAVRIAAARTRLAVARFGIPIVKLDGSGVLAASFGRAKGICGHADVSAVFPASEGHTDPGANFPWPLFMALLRPATTILEARRMAQMVFPDKPLTTGPLRGKRPTFLVDDGGSARVQTADDVRFNLFLKMPAPVSFPHYVVEGFHLNPRMDGAGTGVAGGPLDSRAIIDVDEYAEELGFAEALALPPGG